ncbi:hypothetical protein [Saudi moumouvirus]|nr:hypothetical protein [Saudi moumouvirus]
MYRYIVWEINNLDDLEDQIIGIYESKTDAVNKCNKLDKNFNVDKIEKSKYGLLKMYTSENLQYICTRVKFEDSPKNIYFLKITEYGSGYHKQIWIYVSSDIEGVIIDAELYFEGEHNREDECEDCETGICLKDLKNDLEKNMKQPFHAQIKNMHNLKYLNTK